MKQVELCACASLIIILSLKCQSDGKIMNRTIYSAILCMGIVLGLLSSAARSQKPVAEVKINTEKLIQEVRDKLVNIKLELETFVTNRDWSDNPMQYDIPVKIDIFFESAQPTSFEDRYVARLVLSNGTDYQASDKRWVFPYQQGTKLSYAGQFNPLTGMIEFYMYIMLGQEFDKANKLGGDPYYQKANDVIQQSKFSEFFQNGWKERQLHIEKLLSKERIPLRELEYFFLQAKQRLRLDDRKVAGQYLRVIIIRLKGMNPEMEGIERFYQLHHLDLARMLSTLSLRKELENLTHLDPSNAVTYRQFLEGIHE